MSEWTTHELKILKKEYATADLNDLAARLGRTVRAIKAAAFKNGLKRTKLAKKKSMHHNVPPKKFLLEQKEVLEKLLQKRPKDKFLTDKLEKIKKELGE